MGYTREMLAPTLKRERYAGQRALYEKYDALGTQIEALKRERAAVAKEISDRKRALATRHFEIGPDGARRSVRGPA